MKTKAYTEEAFTLIELLMVVATIGILSGILIPVVGSVRKQGKIAVSKAQLSSYVSAIELFKSEYGFYPFPASQVDLGVNVNSLGGPHDFVQTLSGRENGKAVQVGGNRRSIVFHRFSESEFLLQDEGETHAAIIADNFNNTNLFVVIDGDGDGVVTVPNLSGTDRNVRATVTAYVTANNEGAPFYALYE